MSAQQPCVYTNEAMKKSHDPRHIARRESVQKLFEWGFRGDIAQPTEKVDHIRTVAAKLDDVVQKTAPQWPLAQINKIDLSILRLALYELFYEPQTPSKVVIDEAVELGKEFGTGSSGPFINGVLGNVMNHLDEYKNQVVEATEQTP